MRSWSRSEDSMRIRDISPTSSAEVLTYRGLQHSDRGGRCVDSIGQAVVVHHDEGKNIDHAIPAEE